MKVFGCMAYAHVPDAQRQKLDKKAMKLRFAGYYIESKFSRLLDEETSRTYVSRDVVFKGLSTLHSQCAFNAHSMRINANYFRPHLMRITRMRIKPVQARSTSRGSFNAH